MSEEKEQKLEKSAFYTALGIVGLTIISSIIFVISVRGYDWWFEGGFYVGIFAAGLAALFLFLAKRIEESSK